MAAFRLIADVVLHPCCNAIAMSAFYPKPPDRALSALLPLPNVGQVLRHNDM